jgi:phage-related protein
VPEDDRWQVDYYRDVSGRSPVEEFVDGLDRKMRTKVFRSFELLEERGTSLGMPLARPIVGQRFWELRVQMAGNIIRIFYFALTGRRIILLHGFVKKEQKTPRNEIAIAARRTADLIGRTK